ncbi:MAG: hypothetical protein KCHDKBKB_00653 [Elusimicrobia bacterium]|nr:hypothetical protein [Elusimicrobiota bacterium]
MSSPEIIFFIGFVVGFLLGALNYRDLTKRYGGLITYPDSNGKREDLLSKIGDPAHENGD